MELNDNDIALIERYLQKQLSGEELASFENRLGSDSDFSTEVKMYEAIFMSIDLHGKETLKGKLTTIESELSNSDFDNYESTNRKAPKPKGTGSKLWLWVVLLAGALGAYYYLNRGEGETIFIKEFPAPVEVIDQMDEPLPEASSETTDSSWTVVDTVYETVEVIKYEASEAEGSDEAIMITVDSVRMGGPE